MSRSKPIFILLSLALVIVLLAGCAPAAHLRLHPHRQPLRHPKPQHRQPRLPRPHRPRPPSREEGPHRLHSAHQ